jgi:hypothetical protein
VLTALSEPKLMTIAASKTAVLFIETSPIRTGDAANLLREGPRDLLPFEKKRGGS